MLTGPRPAIRDDGVRALKVRVDPEREQRARAPRGLPPGRDLAAQVLHPARRRGMLGGSPLIFCEARAVADRVQLPTGENTNPLVLGTFRGNQTKRRRPRVLFYGCALPLTPTCPP